MGATLGSWRPSKQDSPVGAALDELELKLRDHLPTLPSSLNNIISSLAYVPRSDRDDGNPTLRGLAIHAT